MAAQTTTKTSTPESICYKYTWSRYVARRTLDGDLQAVKARIQEALRPDSGFKKPGLDLALDENVGITDLVQQTKSLTGSGLVPPEEGKFKVAIVGAGVAGLFTAMLFDWLNGQVDGLDIDYDLIEAAGEERLGGRLYTHKFSDREHDYYDVGAMRFPENAIMLRTFQLFDLIGLRKEKGGLIPYYLADSDNVCPSYFNDVPKVGNVWTPDASDPYHINKGLPEEGRIPADLLRVDPSSLVRKALEDFTNKTRTLLDKYKGAVKDSSGDDTEFWAYLMQADNMSVRQFLASTDNGEILPQGPGYNFNTIEWLETATFGTGWYDQSLSECVFEELDFAVTGDEKYWCIDGGTQRVARIMRDKIAQPVQLNSQVLAIDANMPKRRDPNAYVPMTLTIKHSDPATSRTEMRREDYFAVFNSTTLGALQRMNLKDAGLLWGTKQAIRALGYGASCKVAIKFSRPWWQLAPFNIKKGGVARTDLPLRVCVYPSYNIPEAEGEHWNPDGESVILCSYTWGQDAQRIGSLISPDTPRNEEQLKAVLLHDLALLHANEKKPYEALLSELEQQYVTHHAFDWYNDENMSGAFAYFGPGQFSNMWQEIIKPNAFGQLYLVGEAASSHHAWIVGALESVVRGVYVMLEGLQSGDNTYKPYQDAMNLLKDGPSGTKSPGLPFYPLPQEMPKRQLGTEQNAKQTDDPTEDLPLTYAAAVASLCLIESFFELVDFST
ncbi:hypothetical protein BJ170DRAFT_688221 [Xylariales sp. AK1849]|nr:hypothetical protein BJ170DRAFT_688221 [Xylariales sp. AK1849]